MLSGWTCHFDFRQSMTVQGSRSRQSVRWYERNTFLKNGRCLPRWKWTLRNLFHELSEPVVDCVLFSQCIHGIDWVMHGSCSCWLTRRGLSVLISLCTEHSHLPTFISTSYRWIGCVCVCVGLGIGCCVHFLVFVLAGCPRLLESPGFIFIKFWWLQKSWKMSLIL